MIVSVQQFRIDNYLSLKTDRIDSKEIFFFFLVDWIWRGNLAIPPYGKLSLLNAIANAFHVAEQNDRFYPEKERL